MAFSARASYALLVQLLRPEGSKMLALICLGGAIGIAAIIYFILVLLLRIITREDLLLLPKGEKLANLLKIH